MSSIISTQMINIFLKGYLFNKASLCILFMVLFVFGFYLLFLDVFGVLDI